jgi:hypothetical protein
MKTVDFEKWAACRAKKDKKETKRRKETQGTEAVAGVVQLHATLKEELKRYRGTSTIPRLGVLQKYDEIISHSRKKK